MPPACFLNAPTLRSLRMTGLVKTCHSEEPVRTLVTWESVPLSLAPVPHSALSGSNPLALGFSSTAAAMGLAMHTYRSSS